jgi:hypothetical protein
LIGSTTSGRMRRSSQRPRLILRWHRGVYPL